MLETALIAFTTYFATIGPHDVAALYPALTPHNSASERRAMAFRAVLIASVVLMLFAFFGETALRLFGITLPALRTAGGILLLLIAIDLVFARSSGGTSTTREENAEATTRSDVSVFPLATPLIAGPGAISATILLVANAEGDRVRFTAVVLALAAVLALTYILLLAASQLQRVLGLTGVHVVSRIVGVLLAALAVQFIFDGMAASGLFSR